MKGTKLLVLFALISCASEKPKSPDEALRSRDRQFQQCYLESDSFVNKHYIKKTGQVTISFIVTQDGKVDEERIVSSPFSDANFHACLLEITRGLTFLESTSQTKRRITKVLNFKTQTKIHE
jgi:hypothetical protein